LVFVSELVQRSLPNPAVAWAEAPSQRRLAGFAGTDAPWTVAGDAPKR
jgi:hypothetical protein